MLTRPIQKPLSYCHGHHAERLDACVKRPWYGFQQGWKCGYCSGVRGGGYGDWCIFLAKSTPVLPPTPITVSKTSKKCLLCWWSLRLVWWRLLLRVQRLCLAFAAVAGQALRPMAFRQVRRVQIKSTPCVSMKDLNSTTFVDYFINNAFIEPWWIFENSTCWQ